MTKLYIITYRAGVNFNANLFHNYIESLYRNKWITDWWHYTDNAYIVASTFDAGNLYNATYRGAYAMTYVLIIEINPQNVQGWLPKDAWTWLQKYK